jgi:hypothetical protein
MRALSADGEPLAMTQPAIATEIHQPLDIHRDLSSEISFNRIVSIDEFADTQYLVVGQFVHPPLKRDSHPTAYLKGFSAPNTMDVSESDRDQLLVWDINASDPRHLRFSCRERKWGCFALFARANSIRIAPVPSTLTARPIGVHLEALFGYSPSDERCAEVILGFSPPVRKALP